MNPARLTISPKPTSTPSAAVADFRLGDNSSSDDASDSDQSAHSERSLSPSGAKKSKAKKKKERKQVGALTDELGTLLGAAFQTPNTESDAPSGSTQQATGNQNMDVDTTSAEKTLSKRTRQNIAKMEKRRLARGRRHQQHGFTAAPSPMVLQSVPSSGHALNQNQSKKSTTQARRQRKEKARAKKAAGPGDAMEIE